MAEFSIDDKDLAGLKGQVVIVTGGSNGIGLAMVELLLSLGALVVNGDLEPERETRPSSNYRYIRTDESSWADLVALFKQPQAAFGRPVDHVVANAGVGPQADYLSTEVDAAGDPKEPSHATLDVNLKGVINTVTLAIYHMRRRPEGGSIVINASAAGLQRFRAVDYCTSKHGAIGLGRGLKPLLQSAGLPIRINTLAPSWAESSIILGMAELLRAINVQAQPTTAVARAAALLMADEARDGQLIHVAEGRYHEIDEALLLPACDALIPRAIDEDGVYAQMLLFRQNQAAGQAGETPASSTARIWRLS